MTNTSAISSQITRLLVGRRAVCAAQIAATKKAALLTAFRGSAARPVPKRSQYASIGADQSMGPHYGKQKGRGSCNHGLAARLKRRTPLLVDVDPRADGDAFIE